MECCYYYHQESCGESLVRPMKNTRRRQGARRCTPVTEAGKLVPQAPTGHCEGAVPRRQNLVRARTNDRNWPTAVRIGLSGSGGRRLPGRNRQGSQPSSCYQCSIWPPFIVKGGPKMLPRCPAKICFWSGRHEDILYAVADPWGGGGGDRPPPQTWGRGDFSTRC